MCLRHSFLSLLLSSLYYNYTSLTAMWEYEYKSRPTQTRQWSSPACSKSPVGSSPCRWPRERSGNWIINHWVPTLQIRLYHLNQHFSNKINVDDVINYLESHIQSKKHSKLFSHFQHLALLVADGGVLTRLVHPQRDAVDQDDRHGGSLEPPGRRDEDVIKGESQVSILTDWGESWYKVSSLDGPEGNTWRRLEWTAARWCQYPSLVISKLYRATRSLVSVHPVFCGVVRYFSRIQHVSHFS